MRSAPHEIQIEAGGIRFRALEWPGTGPPSLLLHATSFCADVWGPAWRAACAAGTADRRAVATDARGHGGTGTPQEAEAFAWPRFADDAIALVERCAQSEAAILVGHSSGATAALVAAARRPDLVRAVVAVEPVLFDPPARGQLDSFAGSRGMAERARRRRRTFASREDARQTLAERFPYSGFANEALDAFVAGGLAASEDGVTLRCAPEVEAWIYEGASALDLWSEATEIRVPVLLLRAEYSAIPEPLARRLESRAKQLEIRSVPATTHFAPLERPEAVGRAIGEFLRATAPAAE